jgi:hypothetical protein
VKNDAHAGNIDIQFQFRWLQRNNRWEPMQILIDQFVPAERNDAIT